MLSFVTLIACFVMANTAVLADYHNNVVEFKVAKQNRVLYDVLQGSELKVKNGPTLRGFVFKNCGNPAKDLANVNSLHLGPDPVVFPGDISVSFNISIKKDIDAPLQGKLLIEKKFGDSWIKIPCIGKIGSCDYPDVCDLLKHAVCPPQFDDHKIPCKCPFGQGKYVLPSSTFTVEVPVFPAGDYHVNGNLTYNSAPVACVDLHVTFG